jgi:GTPase SAR1 family protein
MMNISKVSINIFSNYCWRFRYRQDKCNYNLQHRYLCCNVGGRPDRTTPTVGIDFYSKVVNIDNTHRIRMQIWDTAGQ